MKIESHEQARSVLRQAQRVARQGDLVAAERWTKAAERLALSTQKVFDAQPPMPDWQADEQLVEELHERLKRFVACDLDIRAWEKERDIHVALVAYAERHVTEMPPPLRPCPADSGDLERIAMGQQDWDLGSLPPFARG